MHVLDHPQAQPADRREHERVFAALSPVARREAAWSTSWSPIPAAVLPDESDDAPITLGDLLAWPDCPLTLASAMRDEADLDRRVGGPVCWSPGSPPPAQAGALVLATAATLCRLGARLPDALACLRKAGVAALVLDLGIVPGLPGDVLPLLAARDGVGEATAFQLQQLLLTRRNLLYRRRYALERALADGALGGRPRADLLRLGAAQLGRIVYLLDARGETLGTHGPRHVAQGGAAPSVPPPDDDSRPVVRLAGAGATENWLFARLTGDAATVGWLAIGGPGALFDEGDRLNLLRLAAVYGAAEGHTSPVKRGAMVAQLLRRSLAAEQRRALAETLRLDPAGAYAVARFVAPDETDAAWRLARQLQHLALDARVQSDIFIASSGLPAGLLLHPEDTEPGAFAAAGRAMRAALEDDALASSVAISGPVAGLRRLPEADGEAGFGLALLQAGLVRGPLVEWGGDLGPYRALYPLWGAAPATGFVRETLGGLLDRDSRQIRELLHTLLAYVRHLGNGNNTAAALAIHRNTLSYRLRQIEQLSGRSPHDPAHSLTLVLAALLWMLPAALASDAAGERAFASPPENEEAG
ncbi:MAG: helix-turn-helix domain-containing protein [Thermomicrobiales bacterium]